MRPRGHRQRSWGQRGHQRDVIRRATQGEGVIRRAGETHCVQRAVDVLGVQAVQRVQRVQSVMVVSVVPLVRRRRVTLQLLHLRGRRAQFQSRKAHLTNRGQSGHVVCFVRLLCARLSIREELQPTSTMLVLTVLVELWLLV